MAVHPFPVVLQGTAANRLAEAELAIFPRHPAVRSPKTQGYHNVKPIVVQPVIFHASMPSEWHSGRVQRAIERIPVLRGQCEESMNPSISPSLSLLCSSVVQSTTSWNFSTTPNHFHALEMAAFAFKPQYTTSQLLRTLRAEQPAANLPWNKPASSTSSSSR